MNLHNYIKENAPLSLLKIVAIFTNQEYLKQLDNEIIKKWMTKTKDEYLLYSYKQLLKINSDKELRQEYIDYYKRLPSEESLRMRGMNELDLEDFKKNIYKSY